MSVRYTNSSVNRIYLGILIVILLTLVNNGYLDSYLISTIIYAFQVLIVLILAFKEKKRLLSIFTKPLILLSSIIVVLNIGFSGFEPELSLLFKYFGYIVALCVGIDVAKVVDFRLSKILTIGIVLVPLFMVAILDNSIFKNTFFPNSNNFVFWGAVSSFLYYISSSSKCKFRNSLLILFSYILIGSTIGIVLAFILTLIIVNTRNIRSVFLVVLALALCSLLVCYSDIAIFVRIRAVFQTFAYVDIRSVKDLEGLNLYELNQYANAGERTDNTSALWRIQQWLGLITAFFKKWYYALFVGLGENFTTYKTGLPPHNDFLKILCEYGVIVFIAYFKYIMRGIRILFNSYYIYFVLTIVIFHFSENLIHTFPTNFTFYFCIGYACTKTLNDNKKLEYENTADK